MPGIIEKSSSPLMGDKGCTENGVLLLSRNMVAPLRLNRGCPKSPAIGLLQRGCTVYAEDLEFCTQIITALSYIVRVCQERQVEYPDLKNEIKGLIEGVRVRLPSGEIVTREDGSPFHGLLEQINDFQRVADILIEEVELNVTERQALIDTGGESNGCEEEGQEPL